MTPRSVRAPAALRGLAGALFFASFSVGGCTQPDAADPRVLVLAGDTVILPDSIGLVEVQLGRADDAAAAIDPASVQARAGDVVRFTSRDRGAHAIAFGPQLDSAVREFLERSGQLRGPPLLEAGAAWVVDLSGAPPGSYPFLCTTHGVSGTLTVRAP